MNSGSVDSHGVAFRALFEASGEALLISDGAGRCVDANPRAAELSGFSREALRGRPLGELLDARGLRGPDGAHVSGEVLRQPLGNGVALHFVREPPLRQREFTVERSSDEAELRQVTRLYALLSRVNHSLVHLKDRAALLEATCAAAIDFGFHMAWVGLLQDDGRVQPVAQAGHVDGYLDGLVIDTRSEALSHGPTGVAVREGRLDVCADIAREARMRPWHQRALERGYLASAAIPLRTRGRVMGALNLYAAEPGFFSERECQLLRQVGEDLSFAFDGFAASLERERLCAQLEQTRKLDSVGRLAGSVAHDFNNLLSVILGGVEEATELLGPDHPAHEPLQEVLDAAHRSVKLTRQLLTFARRQPMSLQRVELDALVEGALKLLRRLVGEGATVVWHPGDPLWPVRADPSQVDSLLTNLCVNARDALEGRPGGTITLSTANLTLDEAAAGRLGLTPGPFVTLSVADDGAGMSAEVMAHLFEPFFTTKTPGRGTGLGLSTVYGIVKQSGGQVAVHSELGRGSTFTVYLPRADQVP